MSQFNTSSEISTCPFGIAPSLLLDSEPKSWSDAQVELIHETTAEHNNAAARADQTLKFRMQNRRQVLHLKPDPPTSFGKDLDAGANAKRKPHSATLWSRHACRA